MRCRALSEVPQPKPICNVVLLFKTLKKLKLTQVETYMVFTDLQMQTNPPESQWGSLEKQTSTYKVPRE